MFLCVCIGGHGVSCGGMNANSLDGVTTLYFNTALNPRPHNRYPEFTLKLTFTPSLRRSCGRAWCRRRRM